MERLYRAIGWLAGIALVAGLIKALLLWTLAINSLAQGFTTNNSDGLWSIFLLMLNTSYGELLITVAHLLIWGAIVATLFVAWADHRRGWLSALIILTLLALLWPIGVQTWDVTALPTAPPYPVALMAVAQTLNDSLYAIPLVPLALALIFALTRREQNEAAGNRSYNALTWLAGLAIVFGLAFTFRWTAQEIGYYQQLPHLLIADGLFSGITTSIALDLMSGIGTVAMLLVGGATLLAIALAWADRRYGWLTALIAVAIMALLWPTAVDAWGLVNGPAVLLTATPSPVPASVMVAIFTAYAAPLVAVILALIFALTRHRPAPAVAPDGALGVAGSGQ